MNYPKRYKTNSDTVSIELPFERIITIKVSLRPRSELKISAWALGDFSSFTYESPNSGETAEWCNSLYTGRGKLDGFLGYPTLITFQTLKGKTPENIQIVVIGDMESCKKEGSIKIIAESLGTDSKTECEIEFSLKKKNLTQVSSSDLSLSDKVKNTK